MTRRTMLGVAVAGVGLTLFGGSHVRGQQVFKDVSALAPGEFTWHPNRQPAGPVSVIVSLDEQRVHVYRNGVRIAVSTCSTGRPGHGTPTGVFVVLQKDKNHRSSTYNNAPMPNMNRLTWDGIALHAGNLPGYPASHGCVRLPLDFSAKLFTVTHLGTPVIIADSAHAPAEIVHPGLILPMAAEAGFEAALDGLAAKKRPEDWGLSDAYPITSIVASGFDRRMLVLENDREVDGGALTIDGDQPLGEHLFVLQGQAEGGLSWSQMGYGDTAPGAQPLTRLHPDADLASRLGPYLHPGMIFVTTDLPLHPDQRSGRDFVILS
ncbi:L,D-transpeptidase family protein [Rhodobacteraceae bacterium KN286]|uniref:L,D-transpeptidase family protein n=2 Tax=Oceanomicrobium pacificus TaxID=2692916 RepID=A0A6B0TMU7_9RHOB|nr:L,D-transpeptidase family protein [Oceanomicrobium pacificus]